jgi:hypothetical protein
MEQRRLRLGDIVDDYCPRERRVTNHAVVAMIEEEIKQTRCTTCDAEHPYKGGHAPRRRKKDPSSLYKDVLAGKNDEAPHLTPAAPAPVRAADDERAVTVDEAYSDDVLEPVAPSQPEPVVPRAPLAVEPHPGRSDLEAETAGDGFEAEPRVGDLEGEPHSGDLEAEPHSGDLEAEPHSGDLEDGPVHRPLIRATLPRPEGQKEVRNPPDFTIRQAGGRNPGGNQQFRGGNARGRVRGTPQSNGHRGQGGPGRFAGARPGQGGQSRGQGGNFRTAQQPRHGGNRKRSR